MTPFPTKHLTAPAEPLPAESPNAHTQAGSPDSAPGSSRLDRPDGLRPRPIRLMRSPSDSMLCDVRRTELFQALRESEQAQSPAQVSQVAAQQAGPPDDDEPWAAPLPAEQAADHPPDRPRPATGALLERMARALPEPFKLMKVAGTTAVVSLANVAARMRAGRGLPQWAALGVSTVGTAATLALLFKEAMAIGAQRRAEAALRRPDLAGQPLADVVGQLMANQLAQPAASFDWSKPGLFVNAMGQDMAAEVAHVLARTLDSAHRMQPADAARISANLAGLVNGLAQLPDLRTRLADTVSEANGQCQDRVGVSLGRLMMAQRMNECRAPDAAPEYVLDCLLLHAATNAASAFVHDIVGPDHEPSAELMLHAYYSVGVCMMDIGIKQGDLFPSPEFVDQTDVIHYNEVHEWALALQADLVRPQLGSLTLYAGAAVDLLTQHGGTEFQEIFSARLAHRIEPALAPLYARDELLRHQVATGQVEETEYLNQCQQMMQESQDIRWRVYETAVRSVVFGTSGVWDAPALPVAA